MNAQRSKVLGPGTWDIGLGTGIRIFDPDAIALILARASTPLGIANAASAAMIEAYKKGERCVLARFVGDDTGPKAMRVRGLNQ